MHIVGLRPPNDKWKKMKAIYDSCVAGEVPIPKAVEDFFNGEPPDATGVKVPLPGHISVKAWRDDSAEGIEVDVTMLPKGVTILRFYNSW
jgi:hypothetical protein